MRLLNQVRTVRHTWSHGFLPVERSRLEGHLPDWDFEEWKYAPSLDEVRVSRVMQHIELTRRLPDGAEHDLSWDTILDVLYFLVRLNKPEHAAAVEQVLELYRRRNRLGTFPSSLLGGDGFANAWLPGLLKHGPQGWRILFVEDWKPVTGHLIGEWLYEVTGDDVGLWMTALDLLSNWEDDLPNWLEAVAALK